MLDGSQRVFGSIVTLLLLFSTHPTNSRSVGSNFPGLIQLQLFLSGKLELYNSNYLKFDRNRFKNTYYRESKCELNEGIGSVELVKLGQGDCL